MLGLETAHSPNAQDIHTIVWLMLGLAAVIVIAVNAGLIFYMVRFRASRDREPTRFRGRPGLQMRAAAGLAALGLAVFLAGIIYTDKADEVKAAASSAGAPAAEPIDIHAVGQQWIWRYEYPEQESSGGGQSSTSPVASSGQSFADVFSYYDLVVPVDTVINLSFDSTDVVHRWWVPALGGKVDAIPGHVNHASFRADETGTYEGASNAFSGASFAAMRTRVRVLSAEDYQSWVAEQATEIKAAQTHVQQQLASGGPPGITSSQAATEQTGQ
ncbi:MAG: cytochrome c oxidase subunit II [Solirubrobacterales bacterium]